MKKGYEMDDVTKLKIAIVTRDAELDPACEFDPDLETMFARLSRLISIDEFNAFQDALTQAWEKRKWTA